MRAHDTVKRALGYELEAQCEGTASRRTFEPGRKYRRVRGRINK